MTSVPATSHFSGYLLLAFPPPSELHDGLGLLGGFDGPWAQLADAGDGVARLFALLHEVGRHHHARAAQAGPAMDGHAHLLGVGPLDHRHTAVELLLRRSFHVLDR